MFWKATAMVTLLLASPASAQTVQLCTTLPANDVIDLIAASPKAEVPILKMTIAGDIQAILIANKAGEFILFTLAPSGNACINAIGNGLKTASPTDRFAKELAQ